MSLCLKLFIMHVLFWRKDQKKRVTERISLLIDWGTQFLIPSGWLNHWKWLVLDPVLSSWSFFVKQRTSSVNFDLAKVSKISNWTAQSHQNDQFENLYISSDGEPRTIKFGQQIIIIERVTLGTLPQEVVYVVSS